MSGLQGKNSQLIIIHRVVLHPSTGLRSFQEEAGGRTLAQKHLKIFADPRSAENIPAQDSWELSLRKSLQEAQVIRECSVERMNFEAPAGLGASGEGQGGHFRFGEGDPGGWQEVTGGN